MEIKKISALLTIIILLLLFSSCTTLYSILYGSTILYYYDFANKENKSVTGDRYSYNLDIVEDSRIRFSFALSSNRYSYERKKDAHGGRYDLGMELALDANLIRNVFFNKVMICAGKEKYSMIDFFSSVLLATPKGLIRFTEENLDDINSVGFIDFSTYTLEDENFTTLWDTSDYQFRKDKISIGFQRIPIDVNRYKEIKICFDITVEYTTGEIVTINEEVIGLLKVEHKPNRDSLWFPTV